jgi:hypothetical protein
LGAVEVRSIAALGLDGDPDSVIGVGGCAIEGRSTDVVRDVGASELGNVEASWVDISARNVDCQVADIGVEEAGVAQSSVVSDVIELVNSGVGDVVLRNDILGLVDIKALVDVASVFNILVIDSLVANLIHKDECSVVRKNLEVGVIEDLCVFSDVLTLDIGESKALVSVLLEGNVNTLEVKESREVDSSEIAPAWLVVHCGNVGTSWASVSENDNDGVSEVDLCAISDGSGIDRLIKVRTLRVEVTIKHSSMGCFDRLSSGRVIN